MSHRKLNQYSGPLTPAQTAEGINAARRNARRLLKDAHQMLEAQCHPSAAALAILAIEEAGKTAILLGMAVAQSEDERRRAWKAYRSHTKKNVLGGVADRVARGARHLEDFAPLFAEDAEEPYLLDHVKQVSFYTDCLGKAHWAEPSTVIQPDLAKTLVANAELLCRGHDVTEREIQLWVEHLGPVQHAEVAWIKKALANFYAAMRAEGLSSEDPETVARFIWRSGISPKSEEGA